ncbi:MAG: DNA polymerase III subunit beta [Cellvibrionales bacterium]|nr:DNA polymerase III subunit beta [Cellvibrionales bacterium]
MKFSITRDAFLGSLQPVAGVVEARQTLPVLSNVLLVLEQDELAITGTNLEMELVNRTRPESVEASGSATLPARKLTEIVRSLDEGAVVQVNADDERAVLTAGRSKFTLSALPASEFPNTEEDAPHCQFELEATKFKSLIDRVAFSMAQQDVRYYLNGCLLEVTPEHLRLVATDGHRLAMTTDSESRFAEEALQAILPRKGVLELSRLLGDVDSAVSVALGTNHLRVSGDGYRFTTKLIDGKFPDYEQVLPRAADKEVTVEREPFRRGLARVAILSNEKYRGVRILLNDNLMQLTANNPEQEQAEEEVAITYSGEQLEVGFNVSYIIEVLNTLQVEQVRLNLADPNSSALLQDPEDSSTLYVIMPMRL